MKKLLVGALLVALPCIALTGIAQAHSFRTGDTVSVGKGQVVQDTLFASGRTVDVASEVYGDVFCAGQNITISGLVHGDVICAGQTVTVTGTIDGDVRLAGQTVTLGGPVGGNATVASQSFSLGSGAKVTGDFSLASGDGTFNGTVGRDLAVSSGDITIAGQIGRNIKGNTTNLTLSEGSHVNGNVEYTSNNDLRRSGGALVDGTVTRKDVPKQESKRGAVFGFAAAWFLYWFCAMLLTALVLVLIMPSLIHRTTNRAVASPWRALATGFVASILVPIAIVLFMATVIGIPLAFIVGLAWLLVVLLSGPFFGYYIGRLILRGSTRPIVIMLVGAGLLLITYFIPVVGFIALLAALWFGSGMILMEVFERLPRPSYAVASTNSVPLTAKAKTHRGNK